MVSPGGQMDDYIIQIGSSIIAVWLQDNVHQALEDFRCSMEPKGENLVLPMAGCGGKDGLGPRGPANSPW